MKKFGLLSIFIVLSIVLSLFLAVDQVQAATYPTFSISDVEKGVNVTILTKDMPKALNFKVLMGEIGTKGVKGIEVATFYSDKGGSFNATFNIPEALKTRAQIAIRIEGTDNDYYAYNWFWNDSVSGTWPEPPTPPDDKPDCGCYDDDTVYFEIQKVLVGEDVIIRTYDFPEDVDFTVRMSQYNKDVSKGIEAAMFNSGEGGTFDVTFDIPEELSNEERIAIGVYDEEGDYEAETWFWNTKDADYPFCPDWHDHHHHDRWDYPVKGYKGYPYFYIDSVVRNSSVTITAYNLPKDYDFDVLMGKMWTMGVNGIKVDSINSGEGGTLTATFDIPAALAGNQRISIRLQGAYYYAYNWFWNTTAY